MFPKKSKKCTFFQAVTSIELLRFSFRELLKKVPKGSLLVNDHIKLEARFKKSTTQGVAEKNRKSSFS